MSSAGTPRGSGRSCRGARGSAGGPPRGRPARSPASTTSTKSPGRASSSSSPSTIVGCGSSSFSTSVVSRRPRIAPSARTTSSGSCPSAHERARRDELRVRVRGERRRQDLLPQRLQAPLADSLDQVVAPPAAGGRVGLGAGARGQDAADPLRREPRDVVARVAAERRADEHEVARIAVEDRLRPLVDRVAELVEERRLRARRERALTLPHARVEREGVQEDDGHALRSRPC